MLPLPKVLRSFEKEYGRPVMFWQETDDDADWRRWFVVVDGWPDGKTFHRYEVAVLKEYKKSAPVSHSLEFLGHGLTGPAALPATVREAINDSVPMRRQDQKTHEAVSVVSGLAKALGGSLRSTDEGAESSHGYALRLRDLERASRLSEQSRWIVRNRLLMTRPDFLTQLAYYNKNHLRDAARFFGIEVAGLSRPQLQKALLDVTA